MQQLHVRALCAALAIYVFGGCSHDPPTASNPSPTAVSLTGVQFAGVDSLTDPGFTAGLLGDMSDLGPLYLPTDNWWNQDITNAPVDAANLAMIAVVNGYESTGGRLHPDLGAVYGMPYIVVDASTPLVPVTFSNPAESDRGVPGAPIGYPIPAAAKTNLRYFEEEGATGSNNHLLMIDASRRIAYELYRAQFNGTSWSAGSGAIFKLDSNYRRPEGWTSADASGMCVTAGLLRYDEVYGSQPIRHALRCSIKQVNGYVWPASHRGPSDSAGLPLGTRFRLKSSFDISGYSAPMRKIFQAMKTYGLIVADRGGNMYVQGTMDSRWNNNELNPAFHSLKVTDFDIIQRGWKNSSTPPPSNVPPTISGWPPPTVQVGTTYSFTPTASDVNNDPLTFSILNKPTWLTFTASTGRIQGTPTAAGAFGNITIRVSDGITMTSLPPFTITVTTTPPPPDDNGDVSLGLLADLTPLGTLYDRGDNWWNLDVSSAPLDPNTNSIISAIKSYDHHYVHPDFGGSWGIPYCVVGSETPLVPVTLGNTSESDKGYPGGPTGYPIPAAAKTNKAYIEANGSLDGDRHLLIYDRDKHALFELSYASWTGSNWKAGYGAVFKLDSNYRRPEGWTSTDAAGLAVLPGLVRYDEVYGTAPIQHATRFSIKVSNGYVWPASHASANQSGGQPMGMRLRLKKSVDTSKYPAPMRKLFESWKKYGLIVADRGGNMYVQGTLDPRWSNSVLNPAFHSLDADDFEVIKLGWKPTS